MVTIKWFYERDARRVHPNPTGPRQNGLLHALIPTLVLPPVSSPSSDIPGDSGILSSRLRDDQPALHTFLDQGEADAPRVSSPQAKAATPTHQRRRSNPPPMDEDKGHAEEKGGGHKGMGDEKGMSQRGTGRGAAGEEAEAEAKRQNSMGAEGAMEGEAERLVSGHDTATGGESSLDFVWLRGPRGQRGEGGGVDSQRGLSLGGKG